MSSAARPPERVYSRSWHGEGVTLATVAHELHKIGEAQSAAGFSAAGPGQEKDTFNLGVVAPSREAADRAGRLAEAISAPRSRVVLAVPLPTGTGTEAWIDCYGDRLANGSVVRRERVTLAVAGPAAAVTGFLKPLAIEGVRTNLWWMGTPPLRQLWFREALSACDCLIVDSAVFERPYEAILAMAAVDATLGPERGVADFQWHRLQPWRHLLAEYLEPGEPHALLRCATELSIDYLAWGRGNRGPAGLYAGWLSDLLGWELKSAEAEESGSVMAHFEAADGAPVEVAFRPVSSDGPSAGEIMALRLKADDGGRTLRFAAGRHQHDSARVVTEFAIAGKAFSQEVSVPILDDGRLLLESLIAGGADEVYRRALTSGAYLLSNLT